MTQPLARLAALAIFSVPVPVLAASSGDAYVQISAGPTHTLALRPDGTVSAWGNNAVGQCEVPDLPPGLTYVEVAVGGGRLISKKYGYGYEFQTGFSLAIRSDGTVVAWGEPGYGLLDVPALPPGVSYVDVEAGGFHAVALRSDGEVVAWGDNSDGQCDVPPPPPGGAYAGIAAGSRYVFTKDHAWWSWYPDIEAHTTLLTDGGELLQLGTHPGSIPTLPPGVQFVEVASGSAHTVARRSDGVLAQWGDVHEDAPTLDPGLAWVELDAGAGHTLGRVSDGSVFAWGSDQEGQLQVPALPPGRTCVEVSAGGSAIKGWFINSAVHLDRGNSFVRLDDGTLLGWGWNDYGQTSPPGSLGEAVYCAAEANSTGQPARIRVGGSNVASGEYLTVIAEQMPVNRPALFLASDTQGLVPFAGGSQGTLCLGGTIQRIPQSGGGTGVLGQLLLYVEPSSTLADPVLPGQTWNFQCWYRDENPGRTSNFSPGVQVLFE